VDSDSVAGFLAESCQLDPTARTAKPRMFPAYRQWCEDNNRRPVSKQKFNRRIEALCPTLLPVTVNGTQCWNGIRLESESQ
jgi:phage/plasmid-associated DNA primase